MVIRFIVRKYIMEPWAWYYVNVDSYYILEYEFFRVIFGVEIKT